VVAIIAILAAIAIPSYDDYTRRSRARNATVDLMTLSVALENRFQRQLSYGTFNLVGTANVEAEFPIWKASQADFFSYSAQGSGGTYTLTASGTGSMTGCDLTLTQNNTRNDPSASKCGISQW
jgi:type IV pilus assembly protein PilE